MLALFVTLYLAFFQMSAADWAGWLALVGIIAKIVTDQLNRIQDRLDAAAKAKQILDTLAAQEASIKNAAAEREARIVAKIDENTTMNAQALDAANGVNEKLERHSADVKAATEVIAKATEVVAAAKTDDK